MESWFMAARAVAILQPRFRIQVGNDIALGPGKADLLRSIDATGSISTAARELGMSYMRAWSLVQTMNSCFCEPLVVTNRGGSSRGGATLTETGRRVLELYDELLTVSRGATEKVWQQLLPLMTDA